MRFFVFALTNCKRFSWICSERGPAANSVKAGIEMVTKIAAETVMFVNFLALSGFCV